tara:strand:+ start:71 stop:196 length:126 start_codon:yes stop_codon:yes gene_type:complete
MINNSIINVMLENNDIEEYSINNLDPEKVIDLLFIANWDKC